MARRWRAKSVIIPALLHRQTVSRAPPRSGVMKTPVAELAQPPDRERLAVIVVMIHSVGIAARLARTGSELTPLLVDQRHPASRRALALLRGERIPGNPCFPHVFGMAGITPSAIVTPLALLAARAHLVLPSLSAHDHQACSCGISHGTIAHMTGGRNLGTPGLFRPTKPRRTTVQSPWAPNPTRLSFRPQRCRASHRRDPGTVLRWGGGAGIGPTLPAAAHSSSVIV